MLRDCRPARWGPFTTSWVVVGRTPHLAQLCPAAKFNLNKQSPGAALAHSPSL